MAINMKKIGIMDFFFKKNGFDKNRKNKEMIEKE